ncbi:MAG: AI-2E family transporter, partial [Lacticaseibacillus paracasei]|nr:AI-2E family transporter [Lacticaseibacillus paracasei]
AVLKIVVTRFFSWYQQVSGLYEAEHATDDTKQKGVPHE